MSDKEKIELYDKLAKDSEYPSSFVNFDKALTDYIGYHSRKGMNVDGSKLDFMNRLLPIFEKIKNNYSAKSLVDLYGFIAHTSQFNSYYIPDLLELSYFPEDCFNFNNKSIDEIRKTYEKYLYVIEELYDFVAYDRCEIYSKSTELIYDAMASISRNYSYEKNTNSLIPNIILYCIMKNYDSDKLIKMIDYSFLHLNELYDYIALNDDDDHDFELCLTVMENIENNSGIIQEIR